MFAMVGLQLVESKIPCPRATLLIPVQLKSYRIESVHLILCQVRVLRIFLPFPPIGPLTRHPPSQC
jgi:hypothetical protein